MANKKNDKKEKKEPKSRIGVYKEEKEKYRCKCENKFDINIFNLKHIYYGIHDE